MWDASYQLQHQPPVRNIIVTGQKDKARKAKQNLLTTLLPSAQLSTTIYYVVST